MRESLKIFTTLTLTLTFLCSCITAPEPPDNKVKYSETEKKEALRYSLIRIYEHISNLLDIYKGLNNIYQIEGNFSHGENILGWHYFLKNDFVMANNYFSKSKEKNQDYFAAQYFQAFYDMDATKVITLNQNSTTSYNGWYLGKPVSESLGISFGDITGVNSIDIFIIIAEAYYIKNDLSASLYYLKKADSTINIDINDLFAEEKILQKIKEIIERELQ